MTGPYLRDTPPADWDTGFVPPVEHCPVCDAKMDFIYRAFPSGMLVYLCPVGLERWRVFPDIGEDEG